MTRTDIRMAPPAAKRVALEVSREELAVGAPSGAEAHGPPQPLHSAVMEFEHEYLLRALAYTNGSRSRAASLLGISRKTLWVKLKRRDRTGSATPIAQVAVGVLP